MKRFLIITVMIWGAWAYAGEFDAGKKIFDTQCTACHVGYVSRDKIQDNFFKKHNKVYMLSSPTVNMLADAIIKGPRHIGNPRDPKAQQQKIAAYLKRALYHPKRKMSICDPKILPFFDTKEPMTVKLSDADISALARFFMEYDQRQRGVTAPPGTEMLTARYNAARILEEAQKEGKRIIIEASSPDCTWCQKMKQEVLDSADVHAWITKGYVMVDINIDAHTLPFGLQKKFKQITPTFFILESDGRLLGRFPGSWDKSDFIKILKEYMPQR